MPKHCHTRITCWYMKVTFDSMFNEVSWSFACVKYLLKKYWLKPWYHEAGYIKIQDLLTFDDCSEKYGQSQAHPENCSLLSLKYFEVIFQHNNATYMLPVLLSRHNPKYSSVINM